MRALMRASIAVGALMIAAPVAAWLLVPEKSIAELAPKIDLEAAIPKRFGEWRAVEQSSSIVPTADQEKTLNAIYSQTVNRAYINSKGDTILLSVAYGSSQTKELRAHRQEVCYAAQGFKINDLRREDLTIRGVEIPVTRMVATLGPRTEPVTYWFTMGDEVVHSYFDRQFVQLKYALSGYLPDGYLFRMSSITKDANKAYADQRMFAEALIANIDKRLAGKLLGNSKS